MTDPSTIPEGHIPCPHCGQAVLAKAPVCPGCGARLGAGRPERRRVTGIWVLLAGLLACVLGAVGFFFGCATAIGGGSGGRASDWLMNGSLVLGVGGLAVMAAGFIMTLVQVLRR